MSKNTLIHDDSTEPYTVSVHSFSVVNEEDDILITFEVEERNYSNGGNGRDFKLLDINYVGTATMDDEMDLFDDFGIGGANQLVDLAIDLLAKDSTLKG